MEMILYLPAFAFGIWVGILIGMSIIKKRIGKKLVDSERLKKEQKELQVTYNNDSFEWKFWANLMEIQDITSRTLRSLL